MMSLVPLREQPSESMFSYRSPSIRYMLNCFNAISRPEMRHSAKCTKNLGNVMC